MYAYAFEHTSKEYLYPVYVDKNPAQPETYLLPPDTTLTAPPECGEKEKPVWNGDSWNIVEDHRRHLDSTGTYTGGTPYWPAGSTYKDEPSYMAELGPIPAGASLTHPEKTDEEIQTEQLKSTIQESQAYLNSTDYQILKYMDNFIKTHPEALAEFEKKYPDTLTKRQEARDNINGAQDSAQLIGISLNS